MSSKKLEEKASIDWNNFLTPEEVKKFLSKDDKIESAEEIIYHKDGPWYQKYWCDFKDDWTKRELVQDLANFYYQGHLITESTANKLILYHNTTNANAMKINKEGIKVGQRLQAYSKSPEEGTGIWCSTERGYGYGGATITFEINESDESLWKANNTEYVVYRDIKPEEIIDIDLVISKIPCTDTHDNTVESDILEGIESWGKDELVRVLGNYPDYFVQPYDKKQLEHLIATGNKYCKGKIKMIESKEDKIDKYISDNTNVLVDLKELASKIRMYISTTGRKLNNAKYDYERNNYKRQQEFYRDVLKEINKRLNKTESKHKMEEVSRNELLKVTKQEPDLRVKYRREMHPEGPYSNRFKKSAGYKGFNIKNIDTTNILSNNSLVVQLGVGDYDVIVELEDILYWIQIGAESNTNALRQINTKIVTQALMNSMDGMDIKLDCSCADWKYRFSYQASILGYKYGAKEGRPNEDIRANAENRGGVCKHLTSVLSNKRWLQQVTGKFMDWIENNIDNINAYLGLKRDKVLTLPNELARQNAKLSWQLRKQKEEPQEDTEDEIEQPEKSNVSGNNPSTNKYNNIDNEEEENNDR